MPSALGSNGTVKVAVNSAKNQTNSNKVETPLTSLNNQLRQMSNDVTAKTFAFNHNEAVIARDWQSEMSNTSHQREVEDLKRAGLNPVLSANGGASAYSTSSASGSADNSAVSMLASLYNTKMNNDNAVKIARINQQTQRETNKNQKDIANINAAVDKYMNENSVSATRYAADRNYESSLYSSDTSYASSKYSSDHSKYGYIAKFLNDMFGNNPGNTTKSFGEYLKDQFTKNPVTKPKYGKKR